MPLFILALLAIGLPFDFAPYLSVGLIIFGFIYEFVLSKLGVAGYSKGDKF